MRSFLAHPKMSSVDKALSRRFDQRAWGGPSQRTLRISILSCEMCGTMIFRANCFCLLCKCAWPKAAWKMYKQSSNRSLAVVTASPTLDLLIMHNMANETAVILIYPYPYNGFLHVEGKLYASAAASLEKTTRLRTCTNSSSRLGRTRFQSFTVCTNSGTRRSSRNGK